MAQPLGLGLEVHSKKEGVPSEQCATVVSSDAARTTER